MEKKTLINQLGASLLEIIATVAIASVAILMIYNVFSFNITRNAINRERVINANIANATINYLYNADFTALRDYVYAEYDTTEPHEFALLNNERCEYALYSDLSSCRAVLNPHINNRVYNKDNLFVYILPYNKLRAYEDFKASVSEPQVLVNYLNRIRPNTLDSDPDYDINDLKILTVLVIVRSNINPRYDYLLEGVVTQ